MYGRRITADGNYFEGMFQIVEDTKEWSRQWTGKHYDFEGNLTMFKKGQISKYISVEEQRKNGLLKEKTGVEELHEEQNKPKKSMLE